MPEFGKSSTEKLETCCQSIQWVLNEVVRRHDCSVICGARTQNEQQKLFDDGKSKTLNSKHLKQGDGFSHAVDVAPYPIDWDDAKRFYWFAGIVIATAESMDIKLRWGGDWDSDGDLNDQSFNDLVHFETVE